MKKLLFVLLLVFAVSAVMGATIVKKSASPGKTSSKSDPFPKVRDYYSPEYYYTPYDSYFPGVITPDSVLARALGLSSSQKKKLESLNYRYRSFYRNGGNRTGFTPPGTRYNYDEDFRRSYESAFRNLLSSAQRSKYESVKGRYDFDWREYNWFREGFYDADMLSRLKLTSHQRKTLETLNDTFRSKLSGQKSDVARCSVMEEYRRSVESMLNKNQRTLLKEIETGYPRLMFPSGSGKVFPDRIKDTHSGNKKYSVR